MTTNTYLLYNTQENRTLLINGVTKDDIDNIVQKKLESLSEKVIASLKQMKMIKNNEITGEYRVIESNGSYFNRPHQVLFETTKNCNFRCVYCCASDSFYDNHKDLSTEEFNKVIDQIIELNPNVCIISGGEPLLREVKYHDLFPAIEKLRKNNIRCDMFTNGYLIEDYIDEIVKADFFNIRISIDTAIQKELEDISKVNAKIEKIRRGLELLTQNNITFDVNSVVCKYNSQNLPALVDFLRPFNVRLLNMSRALPLGRGSSMGELVISLNEWKKLEEEIKEYALTQGLDASSLSFPHEERCKREKIFDKCPYPTCKAARNFLIITHEGSIYPCVSLMKRKIASLKEKTLKEIWLDDTLWGNLRQEEIHCVAPDKSVLRIFMNKIKKT